MRRRRAPRGANEGLDEELTYPKFGIKLLVVLVVTAMAFAWRKRTNLIPGVFFGLFGLSLLNVAVAVFWT